MLYAAPNRLTRHRLAKRDLLRCDSMRASGDPIGLLALECGIDELVEAIDELRLRNDAQLDPETNKPSSSRHLARAVREGASRFGWERPVAKPTSLRDASWLIGLGVASAIRGDSLRFGRLFWGGDLGVGMPSSMPISVRWRS
jgi:xanthine dehydrogenase YagR molybdenum-binding subunit